MFFFPHLAARLFNLLIVTNQRIKNIEGISSLESQAILFLFQYICIFIKSTLEKEKKIQSD